MFNSFSSLNGKKAKIGDKVFFSQKYLSQFLTHVGQGFNWESVIKLKQFINSTKGESIQCRTLTTKCLLLGNPASDQIE